MEIFDKEIVEITAKRLEGILKNISTQKLLSIFRTLINWFRPEPLLLGKPQILMHVIQLEIQERYEDFNEIDQPDFYFSVFKLMKRVQRNKHKNKQLNFVGLEEYSAQEVKNPFDVPLPISLLQSTLKDEIDQGLQDTKYPLRLCQSLLKSLILSPNEDIERSNEDIMG